MKGTEQTWLGMIIGICFCMPCFASEMKLYERFSLIPYQSQRSFDVDASSYAGIVQNESGIKRLSGRVAMEFRRQRLRESSFDFNGLDRTKQESMDIKLLVRDYEKGLWVTQYSLAYVGQDVEFLNHSLKGDRHAHRLDRLSQSWKRIFSDDLFVELSAGIANCKDQYEG
ncbi:MAG: hypothetical protein KDD52_00350, partial [Bdellovibrionales bacterium]|nr:hypothetical protein [Bdellovibrionales bacterium]